MSISDVAVCRLQLLQCRGHQCTAAEDCPGQALVAINCTCRVNEQLALSSGQTFMQKQ